MKFISTLKRYPNESYKHFMAKACVFYQLCKLKHEVETEWLVGNRYVDIVDKTTRTLYEIEFSSSKKFRARKYEFYNLSGYEIIIIDCSKLSKNIDKMSTYLSQFVVPD